MALGSELLAWRSDVFARGLRVLAHGFVSLCALIVVCHLCFTCSVSFQIFFSDFFSFFLCWLFSSCIFNVRFCCYFVGVYSYSFSVTPANG